ncbi:hypothetical protein FRC03_005757 [Tulasnella sp. 419]|nr:hypothetical protein FRC03_005757 [Tulasnella sp. 419]
MSLRLLPPAEGVIGEDFFIETTQKNAKRTKLPRLSPSTSVSPKPSEHLLSSESEKR